ncbi:Serine/threonine-protein kinase ppk4 [Hypsizygus marmoreus]|uniref:non-specific serine/threonine protein kinase n=1 Tax=Hypsizygus marmoreus TaxID=39966 RepID=A0A369JLV3_HYPMA|nr:Serine/threonine-protein kinase ppk4 [Hypsizygus marmoreus]
MAPILYLTGFLFSLILACFAEIISLRSAPGRTQALTERLQSPTEFSNFHSSSPDATLDNDLELLDIVLMASVDGKFHALNRTSGHTLWSMSSFPSSTSISAPSTLAPLIRTNHIDHDPDLTDETTPQELYIIEPQSGDIYVMATPTSPLQRFPFTMSELVDMSPFSFSGSDDRRVFVGRKETSLLLIELETGKIKATLNSECAWDQYDDEASGEVDLDELEGSGPPISTPTEIYIGRTDYHISILTRPLSRDSPAPRVPAQNLSFSTYGPNNKDNHLQRTYRRTIDDSYIQSLPNGEIIAFKARPHGDSVVTGEPQLLWGHTFNNPIVAIFDVLRKPSHSHHNALALLQPRPQLQDVLPNLTPDTATARLPNLESAYVGIVKETGSLFAMSPARFPLVAFGGTERYAKGRLIDAPAPNVADLPPEVDAITRARKYKERMESWDKYECEGSGMYTDRRCLVGVRRLEDGDGHEGRLKRLLDGPTDGRFPMLRPANGGAQNVEVVPAQNNETLGVPAGAPLKTIGGTEEGWGSAASAVKGSFLEVMAVTFVLGVVSLWFGVKRLREKRGKKVVTVEASNLEPVQQPSPDAELPPAKEADSVTLLNPPSTPAETPIVDLMPPLAPAVDIAKSTPQANGNGNTIGNGEYGGDDSDREGEADGDVPATPGKRKYRRGKRGKKKKVGIVLPPGVEEGDEEKPLLNGSDANANGNGPESPPLSSLVINSPKPPPMAPSLVVSDTILGFGSHGTVVFQGSLQGRAVAVKRLLQDFVTLASREVSILQESDDHPNVIRYYYQEAHANFLYIALELCPASLADIVENPDKDQWRDIAIAFDPKKALHQITSGLRHLHALKLVHRDIKPQNILVSGAKAGPGGRTTYRMLISDFGLCKKLDVDQTSFLPTAHGAMAAGTVGWRAPEILRGEVKLDDVNDDNSMSSRGSTGTATGTPTPNTGKPTRLTKSVDIFALGCVFYYTLTNGNHPFGDRFEREVNILKNAKNLEGLERFGEEGAEAVDLISSMLDPAAYERPDTTTCLLHPFFWDPARRLNFLQDASDRFEIMCRDPRDPYLLVLEEDAIAIVGNDWHSRLDKIFIENLGKFRKYDGRSVQDLLRALRNKKHHYQDMPDNVKRHLGAMPEGFLSYFTRRFPKLFLHVHSVIGSTGLRTESMFRSYFELAE